MYFDRRASEWDTESRISRAKLITSEIAASLPSRRYGKAMEFGCGTGLIGFDLLGRIALSELFMVDTSSGMIDVVNEKVRALQYDDMTITVKPICIDLMTTDSADEPAESRIDGGFDLVFNSMVLHHITDIKTVLERLYELMEDGGEIRIVDLDEEDGSFHADEPGFDGHNGFNHGELKTIMEEIGFKSVKIRTFLKDFKVKDERQMAYSLFLLSATK